MTSKPVWAEISVALHVHIHVSGINQDMKEMILDADVIDDLMNKKDPKEELKSAKAVLTEWFMELKTDIKPTIVERIANDIDEIVRLIRYEGWQNSTFGERELKMKLRKGFGQKYIRKNYNSRNP